MRWLANWLCLIPPLIVLVTSYCDPTLVLPTVIAGCTLLAGGWYFITREDEFFIALIAGGEMFATLLVVWLWQTVRLAA